MEKSTFEVLGGSYIRVGDYLFPDLIITDSTPLGKWGQLRKQYLKEHRPALYSSMLLTGKLDHYLAEIDHACQERYGRRSGIYRCHCRQQVRMQNVHG